ncbi:NAD-dependent epimerase/dehydratase family protein [Candidatus Woesebacteria bacterium]|nr:NAD-dependent epimerase/dehydratase family protein [Candidatus Woesebacteria bacterium]
MSNIIVTGGAGFLGHHLCRALSQAGHQIRVIDLKTNPEFPTTIADVRDVSAMNEHLRDADAVFHLAALIEAGESVSFPQKFVDSNISATVTILEAMRQNGIHKFLFSSSAAVYGDPIQTPIKEDDRTLPVNPYGMTKLAMEGLVSSYVKSHGFSGFGLRYFNLYGPEEQHEPETHAIPRFIKQLQRDQPISVYGDGGHVRDFIYVEDVVAAHLQALRILEEQPNQYHYCNLSTGQGFTVKEIVDKLSQIMQKEPIIDWQSERAGDPRVLLADPTKGQQLLSWSAQMNIDEGLRKTVEYFQQNGTGDHTF